MFGGTDDTLVVCSLNVYTWATWYDYPHTFEKKFKELIDINKVELLLTQEDNIKDIDKNESVKAYSIGTEKSSRFNFISCIKTSPLLKGAVQRNAIFIEDKKFCDMDDTQLWNSLLSLINEIIYDYETEMTSVGIPRIIIEKMKSRNNERISLTIDLIEGICNSDFYNSEKNYLKVYSILNIYLAILENTISGSVKVCDLINGQLKGMSMDGKTEP